MLKRQIASMAVRWANLWAALPVVLLVLLVASPARPGEAVRVEFSKLARVLPWDGMELTVAQGRVRLLNDGRESIGPGARWAETLVELEPGDDTGRGQERLRVVLRAVTSEKVLHQSDTPVVGARALVRADMRKLGVDRARLHVQLLDAANAWPRRDLALGRASHTAGARPAHPARVGSA